MHAERLAPYLSRQLGEQVKVTSLVQAFPGLSRETWLVRIERSAVGHDEGLVLRADPPGGPFVPPRFVGYYFRSGEPVGVTGNWTVLLERHAPLMQLPQTLDAR